VIAIVDYGAGNLFSVANAFSAIGEAFIIAKEREDLQRAERLVLPGVGHFGQMAAAMDELCLRQALLDAARQGKPILGICLGMQMFFQASEEAPGAKGLALLPGTVQRIPAKVKSPHMGWNEVRFPDKESWFYFANSFAVRSSVAAWGTVEYGGAWIAAVRQENITGVQFHPEKSGPEGLRLLKEWCQDAR
jgi:glutamine amidotransferase